MQSPIASDTPHVVTGASSSRFVFSPRARLALLTVHIIFSVGLLGDSAGFLAVAIRTRMTDDPRTVIELVNVLNMFSLVFGIPLSFASLITGVALGLGTRWGVFRYPWVTAKLLLIVSVMCAGTFFIGPAESALRDGIDDWAGNQLIVAGFYDVLALTLATTLGVFKPGGPFRRSVRS